MEPIGFPETSLSTNLRCVKLQNSENLIYTVAEAWNHARNNTDNIKFKFIHSVKKNGIDDSKDV
jgi:hypothetical protein